MRLSSITEILAGQPLPTTPSGDSLDERIAACFVGDPPASPIIRKLIEDVTAAHATATTELEAAKAKSLDPATPADEIAEARRMVDDAGWRLARTDIAEKRLVEVLARVERSERRAREDARRAEVIQRRDAMAAELRKRYPGLVNDLADLLRRLASVDADARAMGLATAEDTARHGSVAANSPVTPLARCRLVDFERRYDAYVWADTVENYRGRKASALSAAAPSQAPDRSARYVELPTLRVDVENPTRGQPMLFVNSGNSHVRVAPSQSVSATILEADLEKVREHFTVRVLGSGEPARRQTQ